MDTYKNKYDFIKQQMNILAVPYELGGWESKVIYPYLTGEFTEVPTMTEDGYEETEVILTGFHRGKYIDLLDLKNRIKQHFHPICGLSANTDSGVIIGFYNGSFPVPTGEADLKRIQINLLIKEWKGVL